MRSRPARALARAAVVPSLDQPFAESFGVNDQKAGSAALSPFPRRCQEGVGQLIRTDHLYTDRAQPLANVAEPRVRRCCPQRLNLSRRHGGGAAATSRLGFCLARGRVAVTAGAFVATAGCCRFILEGACPGLKALRGASGFRPTIFRASMRVFQSR